MSRPERLEEEYYTRSDRERREGYRYGARDAGWRDDDAYGRDYTRQPYRDYRYREPRREPREPPDEYGPSRRALNAI